MPWSQLVIDTHKDKVQHLSDLLTELGAQAVSLEDSADQPLFEPAPGETPLWADVRVVGLFEDGTDIEGVLAGLRKALCDEPLIHHVVELEDQDWERAWLKDFRPMPFGERLWIVPTGYEPPDPDAVNIRLDPGLAFGSGTHPTTAMCLAWLDRHGAAGLQVVDFGCGSGVLAIAAARLGAEHVWASDIDPQALEATQDNAQRNGVEAKIATVLAADFSAAPADLVLANILANPLVQLAERLAGLVEPGGNIVLSGILRDQAQTIIDTYSAWFDISETTITEDWVCVAGKKR